MFPQCQHFHFLHKNKFRTSMKRAINHIVSNTVVRFYSREVHCNAFPKRNGRSFRGYHSPQKRGKGSEGNEWIKNVVLEFVESKLLTCGSLAAKRCREYCVLDQVAVKDKTPVIPFQLWFSNPPQKRVFNCKKISMEKSTTTLKNPHWKKLEREFTDTVLEHGCWWRLGNCKRELIYCNKNKNSKIEHSLNSMVTNKENW